MSSFYDKEGPWSAPGRQTSWEQQQQQSQAQAQQSAPQSSQPPPAPPSRSGTSSSLSQQSDSNAFASQFEEIDRATDNLMKSGKWFPGQNQAGPGAASRRESLPALGRGGEYNPDPRMGGGGSGGPPGRHQSITEFESGRPGSAGLQGYYAGQRYPGGRQSEAEQVLQAKRRMAAQRERELRNYHQEQQYNRISGVKTDRAMSPTTMSEEDRRELIARQHRALYGDSSSLYTGDGSRPPSQDVVRGAGSAGRGPSPLAYDPFGAPAQAGGAEGAVQMPPRDRAESTASPASNAPAQPTFGLLGDPAAPQQPSSRTSTSSPAGSPPLILPGIKGGSGGPGGVAPIGTRPAVGVAISQNPGSAGGLNKRSTTPLTPSSLSYGFNASDARIPGSATAKDERSNSASSNPSLAGDKGVPGLGAWGSSSGGWGSGKGTLAVQPSVWG